MFGKQNGQGLVEYALLFALVVIIVVVVLTTLGGSVSNFFGNLVQ